MSAATDLTSPFHFFSYFFFNTYTHNTQHQIYITYTSCVLSAGKLLVHRLVPSILRSSKSRFSLCCMLKSFRDYSYIQAETFERWGKNSSIFTLLRPLFTLFLLSFFPIFCRLITLIHFSLLFFSSSLIWRDFPAPILLRINVMYLLCIRE